MTYEEIKKKYESQARKRQATIELARAKVEALKALRQNCIETRELYRSNGGVITYENTQNWNRMTRNITALDAKIRAAEIDLGRVSLGDEGIEELTKKLKI